MVVYERESGLTKAELAAAQADVAEFTKIEGVEGEVLGPLASDDGQALQTMVTFNLGEGGWTRMPDLVEQLRDIAASDGVNVHITGAGGQAADAAEAFGGLETTLLLAALSVVIVILLLVYRSPTLWLLPIISAAVALTVSLGFVYLLAKYAGLTVNGQSQAILKHPRDRRRHRLRAVAGGALPGGAASPRGPARGHGVRAAPGRARRPGQCGHRRPGHALPGGGRAELHRRSRARGRGSASPSRSW